MDLKRGLLLGLLTGLVVGFVLYLRRLREEAAIDLEYETGPSAPATPKATPPPKDRLEDIRGIGPVYASRLQAAGIRTFADLAARTPDDLIQILGPRRVPVDLEEWIAEARSRSAQAR